MQIGPLGKDCNDLSHLTFQAEINEFLTLRAFQSPDSSVGRASDF